MLEATINYITPQTARGNHKKISLCRKHEPTPPPTPNFPRLLTKQPPMPTMAKMQKKGTPKTPPCMSAKTRRSSMQQNLMERKRGGGPVGRGGKIGNIG